MIGQVVNYLSIINTQWEICYQRLLNKVNWCYPKVSLSSIVVRIQSRHMTWPVLIGVRHEVCRMSWDLVICISSDSCGWAEQTQCMWGMCKMYNGIILQSGGGRYSWRWSEVNKVWLSTDWWPGSCPCCTTLFVADHSWLPSSGNWGQNEITLNSFTLYRF